MLSLVPRTLRIRYQYNTSTADDMSARWFAASTPDYGAYCCDLTEPRQATAAPMGLLPQPSGLAPNPRLAWRWP
jgi:hypothetical protein